jgi:peptidyl-prolyl cis-trans isomerase D
MLQQIRKAQAWMVKSVLWVVVLTFVVTIFYSWGVRSASGPTRLEVATIFGEPVGLQEFQRVQNALQQTYRNIFRNQPELDLREQFNFREMALEQIVRRVLLLRMAQQNGLVVTDAELYARIASTPAFQEQGRFDPTRYQTLLRSQVPPIPLQKFEEEQRQDILVEKLQTLIRTAVQTTESEVEQAYRAEHEQVAVRYATLTPDLFPTPESLTEEEIQAYFEAHKATYREPEQRQIRYVALTPERFRTVSVPDESEVTRYYDSHQEDFRQEEQVRARHILFKVPSHATPEEEEPIRATAAQVLQELRSGADFATLARQHSEDTASAEKGGDLGAFGRGQMVASFEEAAFALAVGQSSDLVRSDFGYHIIQVEEHITAALKPLTEVQQEIITRLQKEKAQEATLTFLDDLLVVLEENPEQFAALASTHALAVQTTPFVLRSASITGLEAVPNLLARAFVLSERAVDTVEGPDGTHYIFQVAAIQAPTVPELGTIRERVSADLQRQKQMELVQQTATEWVSKVQAGTPLAELAAPYNVSVVVTEPFKQRDPVPQLGRNSVFTQVAFSLQAGEVKTVHEGSRHFVLQVIERRAADMQGYPAEREQYREQLLSRKRQQQLVAFQSYLQEQYQQLRQQGKIVVNPQYVF